MVLYLNYFAIIVMFDQCYGSSHLISTAVYSQPTQYRKRISAEPLSTGATNYYSIEGVSPNNANFEDIQFSASFAQPNVQLSNGDIKNMRQKKTNIQKPEGIQSGAAQVETVKTSNIKYMLTHGDQKPNLSLKVRSSQTKVNPMRTTHQKLTVPMILKEQNSGVPMSSNYYQMSTIPRLSQRKIKPELNSTFARMQSTRFNGLKYRPQILQNYSQNQTINREKSQTSQIHTPTQLQSQQWTSIQPNLISKRQKFGVNQQNFRYDSTHKTESTETPTFEREIKPLESYRDRDSSDPNLNFRIIPLKEEVRESEDKKGKLTSIDSESNYQTQNYDSEKTFNQNYDQNEQINEQADSYGSPTTNDNEFTLPENEANNGQSESEAESETTGDHYSENDKEINDRSLDRNSGSQLKALLEQFIQQLDHLKIMATKELYKAYENNPNYRSKSDDEVTEPLVPKSGYDYQNFEKGLTNTESTNYRDTHETDEERSDYFPNNSYDS